MNYDTFGNVYYYGNPYVTYDAFTLAERFADFVDGAPDQIVKRDVKKKAHGATFDMDANGKTFTVYVQEKA
jgi:hypothetical protein